MRAEIRCGLVPDALPGWDRLAEGNTFYVAADWLRYADTDGVADSRYWGLTAGERTLAAVSSHWAPDEPNPAYVAREMVAPIAAATVSDQSVLTIGGRRGYLSALLVDRDLAPDRAVDALAQTLAAAVASVPAAAGRWWWPYLPTPAARLVMAAAGRIPGCRPSLHLVGADCLIDLPGTGIEDHVASLPTRQRRTNFRREQRRFGETGPRVEQVDLAGHGSWLGPLLANVQRKYGHDSTADQMATLLCRQAEHLGDRAVVFACFSGDQLAGFSLCYRWGAELALRVVGFDYARVTGADEYALVAAHAPLAYGYRHGVRRLHLGIDSYEAKIRRGARVRPLWAVTSFPGGDADAVAAAAGRLAASFPTHEAAAFQADVRSAWPDLWRRTLS